VRPASLNAGESYLILISVPSGRRMNHWSWSGGLRSVSLDSWTAIASPYGWRPMIASCPAPCQTVLPLRQSTRLRVLGRGPVQEDAARQAEGWLQEGLDQRFECPVVASPREPDQALAAGVVHQTYNAVRSFIVPETVRCARETPDQLGRTPESATSSSGRPAVN
jgi:hypothetical protein